MNDPLRALSEHDARQVRSSTAVRLVLVGACSILALAAVHFGLHWVLYTDALMRRVLY